jgi:hydrogenase maturation protease
MLGSAECERPFPTPEASPGGGELKANVPRTVIAGIGNIFLSDDGFGVEGASRLARELLPDWVRVADFGIRRVHLTYELTDSRYATAALADATSRGETPGTVYLIEPDTTRLRLASQPDAHSMSPEAVFRTANALGRMT